MPADASQERGAILEIKRAELSTDVRLYADNLAAQIREKLFDHQVTDIHEFAGLFEKKLISIEEAVDVQQLLEKLVDLTRNNRLPPDVAERATLSKEVLQQIESAVLQAQKNRPDHAD